MNEMYKIRRRINKKQKKTKKREGNFVFNTIRKT